MIVIAALIVVWFVIALVFCLALARAASRPLPMPETIEVLETAPAVRYPENAYQSAAMTFKPAFAGGVSVAS